jgi:hypothetical protein
MNMKIKRTFNETIDHVNTEGAAYAPVNAPVAASVSAERLKVSADLVEAGRIKLCSHNLSVCPLCYDMRVSSQIALS